MKSPFDKTIGVIGGGQLGKMLIESGLPWNLQYNILDPDAEASCRDYAKTFIHAGLKDAKAIRMLAGISDILTYEIEHVNAEILLELEEEGHLIVPSPSVLQIIQDKGLQKNFYTKNHLPTAKYKELKKNADWAEVLEFFEGNEVVAKSCIGGYDGKGVAICKKSEIIKGIFPFDGPCVLEEFIANSKEIAILVASDGENLVIWPAIEMVFDPKLNLVDYLFSPAALSSDVEFKAGEIAVSAIKALKGKGIFAVEMFVTDQGEVLINEIAPRPHNSGHHTIESSNTSQYEQLNRILLDLPLGSTELLKPAVMVNIIGPEDVQGDYKLVGLDTAMKQKGFYLHLYKKNETRPGRKMGHFTVVGEQVESTIKDALELKKNIKII